MKNKAWEEHKAKKEFVCTLKGHTQCWLVDTDMLCDMGCPAHDTTKEHCEVCGKEFDGGYT